MSKLRFHWMLPQAGDAKLKTAQEAVRHRVGQTDRSSPVAIPELDGWRRFALAAERAGIESVLISISRHEPDPLVVASFIGCHTERLRFIVAYRSGLILPTTLTQQLNTLSCLLPGRIAVNMVAGSSREEQQAYGDFVAHDERYRRAEEFLDVCQALWREGPEGSVRFHGDHYQIENGYFSTPFVGSNQSSHAKRRSGPEIYVSGHSEAAEKLALTRSRCWLRGAETPQRLADIVRRSRQHGVDVGLRMCVLCRDSRREAIEVAESLLPVAERSIWGEGRDPRNDSTMYAQARATPVWLNERLWAGLVPVCGPVWTTLLGTPQEIADELLAYRRVGVRQFILSSWPETSEVTRFGREVLPLVREGESRYG